MKKIPLLISFMLLFCVALWSCRKNDVNIIVSPDELELKVGDTCLLRAVVVPLESDVEWSSSNLAVASVSHSGLVMAKGLGSCSITASAEGQSAVCHIVVVGILPTSGFTADGAVDALFSVSDSQQVRFARGNLQYQPSTGIWRFAEHQYDCIGEANSNISPTYNGWIDLFGWGTSGWDGWGIAYHPYDTSMVMSDYGPESASLTGDNSKADWGVYNSISNGGGHVGRWRTPTRPEWQYLFESRTDASFKWGHATVCGMPGLIVLPDIWELPSSCSFASGFNGGFTCNVYNESQWAAMQCNGAVFFPAAGFRSGTEVTALGTGGYYWSASSASATLGSCFTFYNDDLFPKNNFARSHGESVRLVQDVKEN